MQQIIDEIEKTKQSISDKKIPNTEPVIDELTMLAQRVHGMKAQAETAPAAAPAGPKFVHNQIVDESHRYTDVLTDGYVGPGGAHHHYLIAGKDPESFPALEVLFQDGPIKDAGVNGVMDENLAAIIIDRLEGFQAGPYACAENQAALENFRLALAHLQSRTKRRVQQGVEGTHQKGAGDGDQVAAAPAENGQSNEQQS